MIDPIELCGIVRKWETLKRLGTGTTATVTLARIGGKDMALKRVSVKRSEESKRSNRIQEWLWQLFADNLVLRPGAELTAAIPTPEYYGEVACTADAVFVTASEPAKGSLKDFFNSNLVCVNYNKCWITVFRQIVIYMYMLERITPGFTHNDLHVDNILLRQNKASMCFQTGMSTKKRLRIEVKGVDEVFVLPGDVSIMFIDFDYSILPGGQRKRYNAVFREPNPSLFWDLWRISNMIVSLQFKHPPPPLLVNFIRDNIVTTLSGRRWRRDDTAPSHVVVPKSDASPKDTFALVQAYTLLLSRSQLATYKVREVLPSQLVYHPFFRQVLRLS